MIEPVTLDQERFRVPTLRADSRGLVIGERGVLRFSILPQVVAFFQALSEEQSLDHIASSLRIVKVRSRVQGLELLIDMPSQSSHLLDKAAQIARLLQGEAYTGHWPHFVPYRDRQSPFGYDAKELVGHSSGPVFYGQHGALKFELDGELAFSSLLLDLSLDRTDPPETTRITFVRCKRGLRGSLQSFLWRRKIQAEVAELVREPQGRFDQAETAYLFRINKLPIHLFHLFAAMPGIEVYHAFGRNIFVERSYRHAFALENCRRFFDEKTFYFFCGTRDAVDIVKAERLDFVDIKNLRAMEFRVSVAEKIGQATNLYGKPDAVYSGQSIANAVTYQVNLVQIAKARGKEPFNAVLIHDPKEIVWLKKLVYNLPQMALESYRAAFTDQGVFIMNPQGVELVPFGVPLKEFFPRVYVPVGTYFSPPIGYQHLSDELDMKPGYLYIMPFDIEKPFAIPETYVRPLAKYLLAEVSVVPTDNRAPAVISDNEAGIPLRSKDAGLFALWSQNLFRPTIIDRKARKALEADSDGSSS